MRSTPTGLSAQASLTPVSGRFLQYPITLAIRRRHALYDGSYAEILSYLFPRDEASFRARAIEAANSRIWAGIHYRSDIDAGLSVSREVGKRVVARAKLDGSQ